ncbi:MAG: hypothetical protein KatS3mg124_1635 [Porticoccaceae bacterium]|nr:MAG: hypothetical protein KatS3mg124_1635 [Porticoccaceae bacterium]
MSVAWYRQFWPWFLIALPASAVVAGLVTVAIAFRHADSLVDDDYYQAGLAINRTLARDRRAAELGLAARVALREAGRVEVVLAGAVAPAALELHFVHPFDAGGDRVVQLIREADGVYRGAAGPLAGPRYRLRLEPLGGGPWRLTGRLDSARAAGAELLPHG